MRLLSQIGFLLELTRSHDIVRRYFVVNGFDGALTMLGLIIGFQISESSDLRVVTNACLGATIALGMSGLSSAYVSESAERKRALKKLEKAMITDLQDSAHGTAARGIPVLIAVVNGSAPLIISLLIMLPLFAANNDIELPIPPLVAATVIALLLIFLLGVFLGRVAAVPWFRSGVQTLLLAIATAALIYLIAG